MNEAGGEKMTIKEKELKIISAGYHFSSREEKEEFKKNWRNLVLELGIKFNFKEVKR
jgi:YHS domain-containing protein